MAKPTPGIQTLGAYTENGDTISSISLDDKATKPSSAALKHELKEYTSADYRMLIRAASTCLSIVWPQVSKGTGHTLNLDGSIPRGVSRLDQLATVLLSKDKADACAIAHARTRTGTTVFSVFASADHGSTSPVVSIGNHAGMSSSASPANTAPSMVLAPPSKEFGTEWPNHGLIAGPMSSPSHAEQLEYCINSYITAETTAQKHAIQAQFGKFLYLHSHVKITRRLQIPLHPYTNTRIIDVFCLGSINMDELVAGVAATSRSKHAAQRGGYCEATLAGCAEQVTGYRFQLDGQSQIVLDEAAVRHFHAFVCKLFGKLERDFMRLADEEGEVGEAVDAVLLKLMTLVHVIAEMAKCSAAFKSYLANPAIGAWLRTKAGSCEQTADIPTDISTVLEDEEVLNPSPDAWNDPVPALRKWLKLCFQWSHAVYELDNFIGPLRFHSIPVPPAMNTNSQASLDDLLKFAAPRLSNQQAVSSCLQGISAIRARANKDGWEMLTDARWGEWGESFRGKQHHEAVLACVLKGRYENGNHHHVDPPTDINYSKFPQCEPLIGMSKKCCHLCHVYIQTLDAGKPIHYRGTTGKIQPWDVPVWEPSEEVVKAIAMELGKKVKLALDRLGVYETSRDGDYTTWLSRIIPEKRMEKMFADLRDMSWD